MSTWRAAVAVGLGAAAASLAVDYLGQLLLRRAPRKTLNEVLFFPSEVACVEHIFSPASPRSCVCPLPHGVETSFSRLLRSIMSASSSLDLCVFSFSNMDLSRAVVALHRRRVTVRVLSDKNYSAITGSQIGILRRAGISVRTSISCEYMHHKFALVDGRRLINGSLNWTLTAVQSNMENIVVTEEPDLVQPFVEEFQRLWVLGDPANHHLQ